MHRRELVLVPADKAPVQTVARVIRGHLGHNLFAWQPSPP
jgi:hypothetical protein